MKKLLFFSLSIILLTSCEKEKSFKIPKTSVDVANEELKAAQNALVPKGKLTEITFNKTEHDFGSVKENAVLKYTFKFENTGKNDLLITKAQASCGCTVPEYSKEPIKPGESGVIKVSFNTAGKKGEQTKTISVYANTERNIEKLTIKASIPGGRPMNNAPKSISTK